VQYKDECFVRAHVSLKVLDGIPGVFPPRQERSRSVVARLIEVSEELMRTRHFDEISVDDFAMAADTSVGAFYKRFEDKSSFFRALQKISKEEYRVLVDKWPMVFGSLDFALLPCIEVIVDTVLTHFKNREGFIRSSIRRPRSEVDWLPHVEAGRLGFIAAACLAPHVSGNLAADRQRRLEFGIQGIYSIAILAADDDPVQGALRDPDLSRNLIEMTHAYWRA
jgi:AcrR family transcriptional regulator